jgi:hypothetical protein
MNGSIGVCRKRDFFFMRANIIVNDTGSGSSPSRAERTSLRGSDDVSTRMRRGPAAASTGRPYGGAAESAGCLTVAAHAGTRLSRGDDHVNA